jgi:Neisseria PilC beta-propeller domain
MRKAMKRKWIIIPLLVIAGFFAVKFYAQQEPTCTEHLGTFTESFDNTTYKDVGLSSVDHWGQGYITLNKVGSNWLVENPVSIPTWINTVTSGDFDGDGWDEFIGTQSEMCNVLAFVDNRGNASPPLIGTFGITYWIDGSVGPIYPAVGNPTKGVGGAIIDLWGHAALTSGDYDGDGDRDFLLLVSNKDDGLLANPPVSPITRIWLYKNLWKENGSIPGTIAFAPKIDLTTPAYTDKAKGIAWSQTCMQSLDFDGNGSIDIVQGNEKGDVLLWRNNGSTNLSTAFLPGDISTLISTGWPYPGAGTVTVADMDKKDGLDIIVGNVNQPDLRYYRNDGTGSFVLFQTLNGGSANTNKTDPLWKLFPGAATATLAYDFNADGWLELMVGCEGNWYPREQGSHVPTYKTFANFKPGGMVYSFKNTDGVLSSSCLFDNRALGCDDFDLGALLDFNHDGIEDFIIADGNDKNKVYLFKNGFADVYALTGTAVSLNVTPALDPETTSITKVKLDIDQSVLGSSVGLSVTYYVSNNDGLDWELYGTYTGTNIKNVLAGAVYHNFEHFGSKLKWKAELAAPLDPGLEEYGGGTGGSYDTPRIDRVKLDYVWVDLREYSRSSTVATVNPDNNHELIVAATFFFPGFMGHLRAYDVSTMTMASTAFTALQTVSESDLSGGRNQPHGATIVWDAGELLNSRSADDRTIYTAIRAAKSLANPLVRTDLTVGNVATLTPFLGVTVDKSPALINFVRGYDRYWKLMDIDHSNPVVVGPPDTNSPLMGQTGYADFADANKNRTKVVYVGANDGMIHCFQATDGVELWGFVPYNLLFRLKDMYSGNVYSGGYHLVPGLRYVDGSPTVAEVYYGGSWRTVLICGQGKGFGSTTASGSSKNFYFALDVTDPANPQPLWEFSYANMGETWSVPAIARVGLSTGPTWVAFMGSGYNNGSGAGNQFYTIKIEPTPVNAATNKLQNVLRTPSPAVADFNTLSANPIGFRFTNIVNSIPGSPATLDQNDDGNVDYVYFGDLDGHLFRLNTTNANVLSWPAPTAIYTDKYHYPIITKPAVWMDTAGGGTTPRVYFGTGGDDAAPVSPDDKFFAFIGLLDDGSASPLPEWYLGNPSYMPAGWPAGADKGDLGVGEKVWADPIIADSIVYFSTLRGKIEDVNPCVNLADVGKLYGRYIQTVAGVGVGGSAFKTALNTTAESMTLISKTRRAVTIGERAGVAGTDKRSVYVQEYESTIQRLEQPVGALLKVRSWREIYKIIK